MTQQSRLAKKNPLIIAICIILVVALCATIVLLIVNPFEKDSSASADKGSKGDKEGNIKGNKDDDDDEGSAKLPTAVTVGDFEVSTVELNYFYVDAISQFYNDYSNYISYLLSPDTPLDQQIYNSTTGQTWADYFVDQAYINIKSTYALYAAAMQDANYAMTDSARASLDDTMEYLDLYATMYGYKSVTSYLVAMYGTGATEENYRAYYEKCLIAEEYYTWYAENLEYTAEELSAYLAQHTGEFSSYTYAYYYLAVNKFYPEGAGTLGEDGQMSYTVEETAAAIEAAKEAAEKLANGRYPNLDVFDREITETLLHWGEEEDETSGGENDVEDLEGEYMYSSTKAEDVLYSRISLGSDAATTVLRNWLVGKTPSEDASYYEVRMEGDMVVIESSTGKGENKTVNGYYVVRYGSSTDNNYVMKNIRHILVTFSSDTEKYAAYDEACQLLNVWMAGDKTEDSFAEMANLYSDDGDGTTGGLYENIYMGQMVENFESWCYDESRRPGDIETIETEYGYHIMYFIGDSELTYLDFIILDTMRTEDVNEWYNSLIESFSFSVINDSYINKSITIT